MALIYSAQLNPSKIDLLRAWVPGRAWLGSLDVSEVKAVGAYRFDDPDGEVGIETHLLSTQPGVVLHVPLTYRGAPLDGADEYLVTTMDHSVLGPRWVYDGCGDVAYARALATTILTGGSEAELVFADPADGRPPTTFVTGNGRPATAVPEIATVATTDSVGSTRISADGVELTVLRIMDPDRTAGGPTLTGTWPGQDTPVVLATAAGSRS
ncbi:hypothetical protein ABH922_002668 [Rhodococcus sp. 27YEA15]|uniref:CG0192-related protein n=1 Tax=Rhodococcus sp. 27YEA15 TaxID=3156259 RepID=UPI003C7AFFD0